MIVAFSTSSFEASVALIDPAGSVIAEASEEARHQASGVCLHLLDDLLARTGRSLAEADLFAADVGPGSFTGVRVGVTLAKTMAFVAGAKCLGADAFDLIDPDGVAVLPSRKGEYFVRIPGQTAYRTRELPTEPFRGVSADRTDYPRAAAFARILDRLQPIDPLAFNPSYLIDPSISTPKKPYTAMEPKVV